MAKVELTLILPNFSGVLQQEINTTLIPKTLQQILNKGSFKSDDTSLARCLVNHFTDEGMQGTDLPIAGLRQNDAIVLCADPCYLHPDRDRLLLFSESLEITQEESEMLINTIQPLLNDFGAQLVQANSEQWLIKLDAMPDLNFTALPEVAGKAVHDFLPTGDEQTRLAWLRLWNEIQMVLFDLPINEQRQQQGQLPINSLWFWGKGELKLQTNKWQKAIGNNTLLQQLANKADIEHQSSITDIDYKQGKQIIIFEPLDLEGNWQKQLIDIEQILSKVWQQLKWNKAATITLQIPNNGLYQLTPFDCWKPW